jgi:hypothetical protein
MTLAQKKRGKILKSYCVPEKNRVQFKTSVRTR